MPDSAVYRGLLYLYNYFVQGIPPHGHVALHVPQRPNALKFQAGQLVAGFQQ